ncbi:ribonuclease HII, partial [Intrasporangium calvum]|nr:ribonuclease HII [Intrasporangium calvum]
MAVRTPSKKPSLRVERQLQRAGHRLLAGMDEVGRGALAGPVSVGVVLIDESVRSAPTGVKDSKLLTERARRGLVPRIERWAIAH